MARGAAAGTTERTVSEDAISGWPPINLVSAAIAKYTEKRNPERKFHSGSHVCLSSFKRIIEGEPLKVKVT